MSEDENIKLKAINLYMKVINEFVKFIKHVAKVSEYSNYDKKKFI